MKKLTREQILTTGLQVFVQTEDWSRPRRISFPEEVNLETATVKMWVPPELLDGDYLNVEKVGSEPSPEDFPGLTVESKLTQVTGQIDILEPNGTPLFKATPKNFNLKVSTPNTVKE